VPLLDKAEANHDGAPKYDNGRQKDSWAQLAEYNGGGRLESDIGDEEQQHDKTVAFTSEFEVDTHTGNHSDTKIRAIHERHAVHES